MRVSEDQFGQVQHHCRYCDRAFLVSLPEKPPTPLQVEEAFREHVLFLHPGRALLLDVPMVGPKP